eukprot:6141470-Alexandrium_andersonii.AAC.1
MCIRDRDMIWTRTPHALISALALCAASALAALASVRHRFGAVHASATPTATPRSSVREAREDAHLALALLALRRPAAPLVMTAAA